jgi:hypothetical protein
MFLFACPKCQAALRTDDGNGGTAATCPRCRQRLRVPALPPTRSAGAERPARSRRPPVKQPHPGAALVSWLGQRLLGWVLGVVSLVLLNLLVCGGYLGWVYLNSSAPFHLADGTPPPSVSAARLARDYQDDPAAADEKYHGRTLRVTGIIEDVGQDAAQTWYVVLGAEEGAPRVQCFFDGADEDDAAAIAGLRKGQGVTVHGRCEGKQDRVRLRDCGLAE